MAGPLEGDREVLWIVEAESEDAIQLRMAGADLQARGEEVVSVEDALDGTGRIASLSVR